MPGTVHCFAMTSFSAQAFSFDGGWMNCLKRTAYCDRNPSTATVGVRQKGFLAACVNHHSRI